MTEVPHNQVCGTSPNCQKRRGIIPIAKAAGITALAFLMSFLLTSPFTATVAALFSDPEKNDFNMSDLFCQIADDRPVRDFEDRLVILDLENLNRGQIADVLSTLSLCGPSAVAIDINFEQPSDNDSTLILALSSLPEVVLPLGLSQKGDKFEISDKPFFYGDLSNVRYGAVNFPTSGKGATVREYAESFPMTDGSRMPSFPIAAAMAARYKTNVTDAAHDIVPSGLIRYHSKEIPLIRYDELEERAEEVADKIVIAGTTTEAGDIYATPLHNGVSGLEIHSYALSTILDGSHMRRLPPIVADIIAVVFCFLIVWGAVGINWGAKGLILRFAQVAILYLLVWLGYSMLVDRDIVSDFSQPILMVTFGLFAFDLWTGTESVVRWCRAKFIDKKSKKEHQSI